MGLTHGDPDNEGTPGAVMYYAVGSAPARRHVPRPGEVERVTGSDAGTVRGRADGGVEGGTPVCGRSHRDRKKSWSVGPFSTMSRMDKSISAALLVGATCKECGYRLPAEEAAEAVKLEALICECGSTEFRLANGESLIDSPDA